MYAYCADLKGGRPDDEEFDDHGNLVKYAETSNPKVVLSKLPLPNRFADSSETIVGKEDELENTSKTRGGENVNAVEEYLDEGIDE